MRAWIADFSWCRHRWRAAYARAVMANLNQDVALLAKKKQASKTWMLLDDKGEKMLLEVDKYAIMHRVGIHARDLRILDPLLSYPSTILGRERAIVLNLEVRNFSCPALVFGRKRFTFSPWLWHPHLQDICWFGRCNSEYLSGVWLSFIPYLGLWFFWVMGLLFRCQFRWFSWFLHFTCLSEALSKPWGSLGRIWLLTFLFCEQHIKAIITAEEVSLLFGIRCTF